MEADNLIPLSYLSQYYYCPRRAGLLMLEQAWADNEFTVEGSAGHERVHRPDSEKHGSLVKLYDMPVYSQEMGLSGKCDLIEARACEEGCELPGLEGCYMLIPVEFKHGVVRSEHEYDIQLCAQAMCLEQMLNTTIASGYVFYISAHRRVEVAFTDELRQSVRVGAEALCQMQASSCVPAPKACAKCRKCSLKDICMPKISGTASGYCRRVLNDVLGSEDDEL